MRTGFFYIGVILTVLFLLDIVYFNFIDSTIDLVILVISALVGLYGAFAHAR